MKNETCILICELNRSNFLKYLRSMLDRKYGNPKSFSISLSTVNVIESKLIRPRSNYLIKLKGNIRTGEVYAYVERDGSYVGVEAKVLIKHLKYTRWLPWLDYRIRVR